MKNGHGVWADTPFQRYPSVTQQQRMRRILIPKRLALCHFCTYELAAIIDEREESAVVVHLVHPILNKSIKGDIGARDRVRRWSVGDLERKRCCREISVKYKLASEQTVCGYHLTRRSRRRVLFRGGRPQARPAHMSTCYSYTVEKIV